MLILCAIAYVSVETVSTGYVYIANFLNLFLCGMNSLVVLKMSPAIPYIYSHIYTLK